MLFCAMGFIALRWWASIAGLYGAGSPRVLATLNILDRWRARVRTSPGAVTPPFATVTGGGRRPAEHCALLRQAPLRSDACAQRAPEADK